MGTFYKIKYKFISFIGNVYESSLEAPEIYVIMPKHDNISENPITCFTVLYQQTHFGFAGFSK